jgi:WD40 repeat protein/predicted ATPase/DNA-binding XRE family transcriptional regulator
MSVRRKYRDQNHEFGQRLQLLRTRVALTQVALAEQLGVHRRSLQNWETGLSFPKAEKLQQLIAVLLRHHAFIEGQELQEAQALWSQAAQDGPHRLPAFDKGWFTIPHADPGDRVLGARGQQPAPANTQSSIPNTHHPIIDWGEAIAVPTLYGREREIQTLHQWVAQERCRMVAIVGIGGIGKSSLAITVAQRALSDFDVVAFRSLQNGPPLAEVLDQAIRAVADQPVAPPKQVPDKIALLIQLFRARRCLLVFDNFETILQPGALAGTYRTGYADYGALLQRLSSAAHQSCLVLTSREKPAELGPIEGRNAPVRMLPLTGLDERAWQTMLAAKDIVGTANEVAALSRLYGGNPLALNLVAEPIRELFGSRVDAFLAAGDAFFNGVGTLMQQQCARSTPLEHAILDWLAIERELVPIKTLLARVGDVAPQRDVLAALESLLRRMHIERGPNQPAFTLQPVILEFVTGQLVGVIFREIMGGRPRLLHSRALVQATASEYVRRSQERLIAAPLLERLLLACGDASGVEQRLLALLETWRDQPPARVGYGPGNLINLLRLMRGHLRGLDLARLTIQQANLQGVDVQDSNLDDSTIQDSTLTEVFDSVSAVTISSGANWAAASRSGEVRVWDASGQSLQRAWQAHADMICAIAFSPDGHTLATTGSWDGTVKLWDVASGALRWSGRHTSYTNIVAFAPNGKLLASAGNDATVRLWDQQNGTLLETLLHPEPVAGVAWSPQGDLLATGDRDGRIRLWVVNGAEPATCVQIFTGHTSCVEGLAFAPDGGTLASASWDGTIKLWDTSTLRLGGSRARRRAAADNGRLRQTLVGHSDRVNHVAWSPDGSTLASSSRDPTIWLWNMERGTYRTMLHGHTAGVTGLAFTPDSHTLLSSSEDGTLRLWHVASGQCIRTVQGYASALYDVDWSPDGAQLVSGGTDTLVSVHTLDGATPPLALRGHRGVVIGVGWSADGRWLASSEWDNAIRLWDPASGECRQILQHPNTTENFFDRLAWSPDGRRLACGTYGRGIQVFEMSAHQTPWGEPALATWIRHVAWSPDGTKLAGGGADGAVYIWNTSDGTPLQRMPGHGSTLTSVAWSPDGVQLASGSSGRDGGELFVWDVQRGERICTIAGQPGIVYALAWGASNDIVITGGGDGLLRWWDVRRRTSLWVREAHWGTVHSLRRSPDGTMLASCAEDGAIMIWDVRSGTHLQTLRRDRPYERLSIHGIKGLTEAQIATMRALGAVDVIGDKELAAGAGAPSSVREPDLAELQQPPFAEQGVTLGLPFQPTSFIGRGAEVIEIGRLLADPACRLLTLLGPGGMGKTRLAIEAAGNHAGAFRDGAAFVGLGAVSTPDQMVLAIGETLKLSFTGQPDPTTHLIGYLRERQMLLVLDDFEHLLAGADLVTAILARAPRITMLLTSRERLNLQAEWLFDVGGLAYPQEDQAAIGLQRLAEPASYSAVELFVQRARQIQPSLSLSEPALVSIVKICKELAGIPLAIELAAAGVRTLSIAAIEQQIRANLDVLATTRRDVLPRHRSMRAVFDHSWRLLSEPEQALLSRLAVFQGSWTADAAAAVCREQETGHREQQRTATALQLPVPANLFPTLTTLIDKSLVRQVSAAAPIDDRQGPDAAQPYFTLLGPIREYALEQLVARGEATALQRTHASYYLRLVQAAAADWYTPKAEPAIEQLDRAHDNLRAALQWARDGGDPKLGLQLGGALRKYWRRRGTIGEGRVWLDQLLALDHDPADIATVVARLHALEGAAWLASDQHDYAHATRLFEQSAALRLRLGETDNETNLLVSAAIEARAAGEYQRATALLEDALAQQHALGDRGSLGSAGLGLSLFLLGLVLREQGDIVRATVLFAECVELHRAIADREGQAVGLLGLADIARDQGDLTQLRAYGEESLAILRQLGVQWAIGFALNNLALGAIQSGDLPHAAMLVSESVSMFRAQQADASLAEVLITLGRILHAQGDRSGAHAALAEALRLAQAVGPRLLVAAGLEALAGLIEEASLVVQLLAAASALRAQMGTPIRPVDQAAVEHMLAAARSALGDDRFTALWDAARVLPVGQLLVQ